MNADSGQQLYNDRTDAKVTSSAWAHLLALSFIFLLCAFPSLYHGISRDALVNSDMDLVSVYQALLINAGQPLVPIIHTGYFYFMSLAGWFQLFDWLGLISVHDLDSILAAPDFNETFASLIQAGRWFSIFLAWALVGLVYGAICILFRNLDGGWWISLVLCAVLAVGGGGIAGNSVMLRTELPSMVLLFSAALGLMAIPHLSYLRGLLLLIFIGFLIHAAMMVKIQIVILILFLPFLPLLFGWCTRREVTVVPKAGFIWCVLILAIVCVTPIAAIFIDSLAPSSLGLYQGLIAVFVIICALVFGRISLGAAYHGVVGLAAIAIGFSVAYGIIYLNANWWTTYSVVNPLEQLSIFTTTSNAKLLYSGSAEFISNETNSLMAKEEKIGLASNILETILVGFKTGEIIRFANERLQNLDYPFLIFYVLVPAAIVALAMASRTEAAIKAGFLFFIAIMIIAIFWIGRGFFNYYYSIYVEVWVILASAIVLKDVVQISISWPKIWLRVGQVLILMIALSVITINVRFRLMNINAANPLYPNNVCYIRGLTPLFYIKFDEYCGTG